MLADDFAELQEHLASLPPSCLGSRRVAEDFRVLRVAGVDGPRFDGVGQNVVAQLRDTKGQQALLVFPYTSRGRGGAEALLAKLGEAGGNLLFVSGLVRRAAVGLIVEPVALVFQDGATRRAVQPWIDTSTQESASPDGPTPSRALDPLRDCLQALGEALEELLLLGLQRADGQIARKWRDLQMRAEATGLARLSLPLRQLAEALESKAHTLRWDAKPAARLVLAIALLFRLAQDVAP